MDCDGFVIFSIFCVCVLSVVINRVNRSSGICKGVKGHCPLLSLCFVILSAWCGVAWIESFECDGFIVWIRISTLFVDADLTLLNVDQSVMSNLRIGDGSAINNQSSTFMHYQLIYQIEESWTSFQTFQFLKLEKVENLKIMKNSSKIKHALKHELHTMQIVQMSTDCNFMPIIDEKQRPQMPTCTTG